MSQSISMSDLRVRFGFILAMAMLPLLVFAIWQSLYDYRRDQAAQQSALTLSGQRAVFEIIDTVDSAKSVLLTIEETVGQRGCDADLEDVLKRFSRFDDIIIARPDGAFICSANNVESKIQGFELAKKLTPENPHATETQIQTANAQGRGSRLLLAYGQYDGQELQRILIVEFGLSRLARRADLSKLGRDAKLSMLNRKGETLFGDEMFPQKINEAWLLETENSGEYQTDFLDASGDKRSLILIPSREKDIFVAVSAPTRSIFAWSFSNPLSSIMLPLFAWIFGFVAIWWAADRLILIHIRKLQRATLKFAEGDQDQRVGKMKNPPASIRTLGRTIDYMADQISVRESELKDSLDQKETLLREIHHRVKNNLQIIISLLNMQERKVEDTAGLSAIQETRNRINAIALVHRGLYEGSDLRYIDMQTFLGRLVGELCIAMGCEKKGITSIVEADCDPMEADTAIPVALYVVETLTNSTKHGVMNGGEVKISIVQDGKTIVATVSDNGQGQKDGEAIKGTGTKLIKGFARQLGGDVKIVQDDSGYSTIMKFKLRPSLSPEGISASAKRY